MAKKPRKKKTKVLTTKKAMVFKHTVVPERAYDDVADRVMAACKEFDAAMNEAYGRLDMHVFYSPVKDSIPMKFSYRICKVTHTSMFFPVDIKKALPTKEWVRVKENT